MRVEQQSEQVSSFRLDVPLHDLLTGAATRPSGLQPFGEPQTFPEPVFPQHPELLAPIDESPDWAPPDKRKWTPGQIYHTMQGWLFPYIRSRVTAGALPPPISLLFTPVQYHLECR